MASFKKGFVAPSAPKCYICTKSVYKMEEVIAIDRSWHKLCFKCGGANTDGCNRTLTLDAYSEHNKEPYCNPCYRRSFGAKGVGFGISTMTTEPTTATRRPSTTTSTSTSTSTSTNQEEVTKPLSEPSTTQMAMPPDVRNEITREVADVGSHVNVSSLKNAFNSSNITSTTDNPKKSETPKVFGINTFSAPKCKVCKKTVYKMEEVVAINHFWHKSCFTCGGTSGNGCNRSLHISNYSDHGSDPYCNACYTRLYRPKGVGYGNTLNTEEGHKVGVSPNELANQLETAAKLTPNLPANDNHPSLTFAGDGDEVNDKEWG